PGPAPSATAGSGVAAKCEDLAALKLPDTTIASARSTPAGTVPAPFGPAADVPATCRVAGSIKPSADSDIQFEVWMPLARWNGKCKGRGNGGSAGASDQAGRGRGAADGYATAGTDTGHRAEVVDARWATGHPEKVIDFGYRAIHEMTDRSKAVVRAF